MIWFLGHSTYFLYHRNHVSDLQFPSTTREWCQRLIDAAIAEAAMKALRPLGLALSWAWITSAFLIDIAVLFLATHLPVPLAPKVAWWAGVAVAALATIATLLTYNGITVASTLTRWIWDWSADLWDSSADSVATLSRGCTRAIDHRRRFGRQVVGVREYQGQLVSVIAITEATDSASGRLQHEMDLPATFPVAVVAARLRQFDVRLDAVDIVSVQKRRDSETADPTGPIDDRPARMESGTWLVLRMDPQSNVAALAARDSVVSTMAAVTERLAGDLNGQRCAARPLTADEFAEVDAAIMAGLKPATRPGLRHLKHFDGYATSFWMPPRDITSETVDRLWRPDIDASVVTIRLAVADGRPEVSAWVRYHSGERLGKEVWAGLNRLTGRQVTAVRASLPAPTKRPPLVVPARVLGDDDPLVVRVDPTEVDEAPVDEAPQDEAPQDEAAQESTNPPEEADDAPREAAVAPAV